MQTLHLLEVRPIANISNKEPKKYLVEVVDKPGEEILDHHNLPEDTELWELDNYQEFLNFRRKQLVKTINGFIEKLSK